MPGPRSRRWVWFFAVLAVLTVAAISVELWYKLAQKLTPDKVHQARALWQRTAPADYDLDYLLDREVRTPDRYRAEVRDGTVTSVTVNDRPLPPEEYPYYEVPALFEDVKASLLWHVADRDLSVDYEGQLHSTVKFLVQVRGGQVVRVTANGQPLDPALWPAFDASGLFTALARRTEEDASSGAWVFSLGTFDPQNGLPLRYVRSVRSPRERVQCLVQGFTPVGPGPDQPGSGER
jgi:Family of unknown function (DUF6174)